MNWNLFSRIIINVHSTLTSQISVSLRWIMVYGVYHNLPLNKQHHALNDTLGTDFSDFYRFTVWRRSSAVIFFAVIGCTVAGCFTFTVSITVVALSVGSSDLVPIHCRSNTAGITSAFMVHVVMRITSWPQEKLSSGMDFEPMVMCLTWWLFADRLVSDLMECSCGWRHVHPLQGFVATCITCGWIK